MSYISCWNWTRMHKYVNNNIGDFSVSRIMSDAGRRLSCEERSLLFLKSCSPSYIPVLFKGLTLLLPAKIMPSFICNLLKVNVFKISLRYSKSKANVILNSGTDFNVIMWWKNEIIFEKTQPTYWDKLRPRSRLKSKENEITYLKNLVYISKYN